MSIKQITYLILIVLTFSNCQNDLTSDEKILSDIFPQLVDSLHLTRTNIFPPPPRPIYDNDSNFIDIDTNTINQIFAESERKLKRIDSIDSRIILGVNNLRAEIDWDQLKNIEFNEREAIKRLITANGNSYRNKSRKLDINQIVTGPKYELIEKKELEVIYEDLWRINDRKFGGLISVSNIYLDDNSNFGLLQFETFPFKLEGAGYYIIIERIKNKWRIKKIIDDWIS